jgi:hypothetical protein
MTRVKRASYLRIAAGGSGTAVSMVESTPKFRQRHDLLPARLT